MPRLMAQVYPAKAVHWLDGLAKAFTSAAETAAVGK